MCAEINYLIPLLLLLHYKVKFVHQVRGCIYFFNTGTSLCLRCQPATWTFFVFGTMAHFLPHSMGEEWEWKDKGNEDMGSTMKKKKWYIYFCLLHKCLVGWGKICLLVCENHSLIILFMAKNHKQVEQSYVLRAGMIAMCTFLFVLYNVNMIISKLTFWDMVGFWMKV